jgi:hypothetical protein
VTEVAARPGIVAVSGSEQLPAWNEVTYHIGVKAWAALDTQCELRQVHQETEEWETDSAVHAGAKLLRTGSIEGLVDARL